MAIVPKAKREVTLGFIRDGQAGQVTVVPEGQGKYELGDIGVQPVVHPQVVDFSPGAAAAEAGLQRGDVVLGGRRRARTSRASSYSRRSRRSQSQPLALLIMRGGAEQTSSSRPGRRRQGDDRRADQRVRVAMVEPGPIEASS